MRLDQTDPPQAGDVVVHDGVCVLPLFPRRAPVAGYTTLDAALADGFRITEIDDAGDVGRLRVTNPTTAAVLLYDGQGVVGAKQDRILDVTVLVAPGSTVTVPVSCVEQGRWRHSTPAFAAAGHTSHPELRRRKAERLSERLSPGAAQHEVWAAVAQKSERLGVRSPTAAQSDVFADRAPDLDRLAARFPAQAGQCGMVLGLAGAPVCVDLVSRPDAFAALYPILLRGYLLDAIEHLGGAATTADALEGFLAAVTAADVRPGPAVGLGRDLRLAGPGVVGSGLALDDEVLQLSAYAVAVT